MSNGRSSHPPTVKKSSRPPNGVASRPPPSGSTSRPPKLATSTSSAPPPAAARKRRRLRKDEIVAEATRLFAERGYEGASMGDLAKRVGLRKASLFHHFPSKDVLYAAVLTELLEGLKSAVVSASSDEGAYADRLDRLTDTLTTALVAQPQAARLLVREAMDWGPVMKQSLGRTINDVLTTSLALVKAGQDDGAFNDGLDPAQVIVSFIGVLFMPFVLESTIERFTGASPFDPGFLESRKAAVRMQMRDAVIARKSKK